MEPASINDMSTATARIAYDGEALREGIMDVRDLAPALLEIGALCERVNHLVNGEKANISVNVRAEFKAGSFAIDLDIVQKILEQVRGVIWGQSVQDAKYILEILGLSFGGGVFGLYKWFRGKRAPEVPRDAQVVSITINNNVINFPRQVIEVYNDDVVRSRMEGALLPLLKEGIEEFQVRQGGGPEPKILERVNKEEVAEAVENRREEEASSHEETISDYVTRTPLVIVKPSFREGLKWDFARDSRSAKFSVEIKDIEFLERMQRREERLGVGDILDVDLRTRSFFNAQGQLRTEYEVVRVYGLIEPPSSQAQASLFTE